MSINENAQMSENSEKSQMIHISVGELKKLIQSECETMINDKISATWTKKDTAGVFDIIMGNDEKAGDAQLLEGLDPIYAEAIQKMKMKKDWDEETELGKLMALTKELYNAGHPEHAAQLAFDKTLQELHNYKTTVGPILIAATAETFERTKAAVYEIAEDHDVNADRLSYECQKLLSTDSERTDSTDTMFDMEPEQAKELFLRVLAYMTTDGSSGQIVCQAIVDSNTEKMVELREHIADQYLKKHEYVSTNCFGGLPSMNVMVSDMIQDEMYFILKRNFEKLSGTELAKFLINTGKTYEMADAYAELRRIITSSLGPLKHDNGLGKIMIHVVCRQAVESNWGKGIIISLINNDRNLFRESLLKDPEVLAELSDVLKAQSIKQYTQKIVSNLTESGPAQKILGFFKYINYALILVLFVGILFDLEALHMGLTFWNRESCDHNINRLWVLVGGFGLLTKWFHPTIALIGFFNEHNANILIHEVLYGLMGQNLPLHKIFYHTFGLHGVFSVFFFLIEIMLLAMMTVVFPKYGCEDGFFYTTSLEIVYARWLCYSVVLLVIPAQLYLDNQLVRLEDGHLPV